MTAHLRLAAVCLLTLMLVVLGAPHASAQDAGAPMLVLDGKGWGHGVGLSQWGAKYMADGGATHEAILSTFYPGTELTTAGSRTVRVAVYTAPADEVTLTFPSGGELRSDTGAAQAPGFPVPVAPGGTATITYDGSYHVTSPGSAGPALRPASWNPGSTTTTREPPTTQPPTTQPPPQPPTTTTPPPAPPPPPPAPPPAPEPAPPAPSPPPPPEPSPPPVPTSSTPIWAAGVAGAPTAVPERGRQYRGWIEATAAGGPFRLVNQLDVETYLKGMAEVPADWPLEAIKAQTDAARTYALRSGGELCDDDHCQVYVGVDAESANQTAAVNATAGEVVTYGGALADTFYCADAGGVTATTLEGFGTSDVGPPYLSVVRYATPDPLPWRVELPLGDVATRFEYAGAVTGIRVGDRGPSGRALTVVLDGSAGPVVVDGRDFADKLDLKSTLFEPTLPNAGSTAPQITQPAPVPAAPAAPPAVQTPAGDGTNPLIWLALVLGAAATVFALQKATGRAVARPEDEPMHGSCQIDAD